MNIRMKRITGVAVIFCLLVSTPVLFAQGIKERMKERLPFIVELKEKGIIGENFVGYLEFVTAKVESEEVVNSENEDRKSIYSFIAQKEGATIDLVGIRRAKQIAENAKPGEYLKGEDGKWYQKK